MVFIFPFLWFQLFILDVSFFLKYKKDKTKGDSIIQSVLIVFSLPISGKYFMHTYSGHKKIK